MRDFGNGGGGGSSSILKHLYLNDNAEFDSKISWLSFGLWNIYDKDPSFKIQQTYIWEVRAVFAEPEHDESTVVDGGGVILPNAVVLLIDLSEFLLSAAATHTYHT